MEHRVGAQFEAGSSAAFESMVTFDGFRARSSAGAVAGGAANTAFCEDFNEQVVCNPAPSTASTLAANVNGGTTNSCRIRTGNTPGRGDR
ncbi:MAG TPA: hypothetical protein VII82_14050 [Polyangiaceae bacterium]